MPDSTALAVAGRGGNVSPGRQIFRRPASPPKESPVKTGQNQGQGQGHGYSDGTTGLKGCTLTLPKYSKRLSIQHQGPDALEDASQESPRPLAKSGSRGSSPNALNRKSPSRTDLRSLHRNVDRCHADLYEDAFARQQRRLDMKDHLSHAEEIQQQKRAEAFEQGMRDRRRIYRMKDTRTQLEREEEMIRKREAHRDKLQTSEREREDDELKECTFKPQIFSKHRSGATARQRSPRGRRNEEDLPPAVRLRQLVERQRNAAGALQAISVEDSSLREHLRTVHAELHDRIQREETQRVVTMLQDTDADGSTQKQLIQRVRSMVHEGTDPQEAQKQIVEELVARSQDEVRRRVLEAFGPLRLEQEGDLYTRRLAVVHELEAVEAQLIAMRGGALVDSAKDMGFEFGLAERARRTLPPVPSPSTAAFKPGTPTRGETGDIPTLTLGHQRLQSAGSSSMIAGTPSVSPNGLHPGLLQGMLSQTPRSAMTPLSPASQSPSRQSSGQQPSLSGSVLQPNSPDKAGHDFDGRSASGVSLPGAPGAAGSSAAEAIDAAKAQLTAGAFFAARSRVNVTPGTSGLFIGTGGSPATSRTRLGSKEAPGTALSRNSSAGPGGPPTPKGSHSPVRQVLRAQGSNGVLTEAAAVSSTTYAYRSSQQESSAPESGGATATLTSPTASGVTSARSLTPAAAPSSLTSPRPGTPAEGDKGLSNHTVVSPRPQAPLTGRATVALGPTLVPAAGAAVVSPRRMTMPYSVGQPTVVPDARRGGSFVQAMPYAMPPMNVPQGGYPVVGRTGQPVMMPVSRTMPIMHTATGP